MRAKLILAAVIAAVIAGAYLAGYWSERGPRMEAEAQVEALRTDLAAARAQVRVGQLLGRALTLKETAMSQNYGQALDLSSAFFDEVGREAMAATDAALRDDLAGLVAKRDSVTAALAKGDPAIVNTLSEIEVRLRQAVGYPTPTRPAAAGTPSPR
ncbi:MAG: hypothetical protein HY657_13995 [Acidobacteria bacterium]|nr:hypothetical protein [Acidobacteriota bacterium]